ncbi:MAG: cation:proton antiporter [Calditrichaceae bacterium]|jgi:Kef-type K+ transport system membrane component KefB
MNILVSLVLLVLIAYLGSLIFRKYPIKVRWLKSLVNSGNLYILLGFAIGPNILNLIDGQIINQLNVLYALVLGWAGFLIGLQTSLKNLKRFRKLYYYFATTNFVSAFCLSSVLLIIVFHFLPLEYKNIEIVILAIASAVSSPIMLGIILRDYRVHGKVSHLLQFVSGFDNILGVIILGLIMAGISDLRLFNGISLGIFIIVIPLLLGSIAAYLYYILAKEFKSDQENFLLLISLLIFIIGIAFYLNQSLLFTAFVFGMGLSNLPIKTKKLFINIQQVEKPLYIMLLIFVGFSLNYLTHYFLLFLFMFLAIHFVIVLFSGYVSNKIISNRLELDNKIGLANLGMGGVSLAIILDFHLTNPSDFSILLIFVLAVSIVIFDIITFKYLEDHLIKKSIKQGNQIG